MIIHLQGEIKHIDFAQIFMLRRGGRARDGEGGELGADGNFLTPAKTLDVSCFPMIPKKIKKENSQRLSNNRADKIK